MMRRPHVGFTAFARDLPMAGLAAGGKVADDWLDYLRRLVAVGCDHVQFLPPDSPEDGKALGAIAKIAGVTEASVLYCTFHPVCPCVGNDAAFDEFTATFSVAKEIMAPFNGIKRIFSPSLLRGLMDPNRGLADGNDRENQIAFLHRVCGFLKAENRGDGFELAVEPLNRFETRGPNTVAETVAIIKDAHAAQRVKVGVDTFHSFMERGSRVVEMWTEYAPHISLIHASAMGRGHFWEDAGWMSDIFSAISCNKAFDSIPIVVEAFCHETNPGFLPVLGIHAVSSVSAAEMAAGTVDCLRSWMR